ncbi:MAG TPA: hypothetical protein VHM19_20575, partial [Polyangiales bacterium]|nr:hypothetical protein [Polyangiales bacterium]
MIQLGFDAAVIVASIWIATLVGHAPLSDGVVDGAGVALFAATSCTLLFLQRRALLALHERRYESGARRERLIFAGAPSRRMHEALRAAGQRRFAPEVIGWLEAAPASAQSTSLVPADTLSLARLGSLDELPRVLQEHPVDHVMFFAPVHDPVRARAALDTCNSQRVVATFVADPQQVGEHGPASFGSLAASRNALAVKDALDPL